MLTTLRLTNFRSYARLTVALGPAFNVFFGPNGAGKTNLLEAVGVLSTGRSPRGSQDADLARFGEGFFHVKGSVALPDGTHTLEVVGTRDEGKAARLNGHPIPTLAHLAAKLPSLFFSPEEIGLVAGPPIRRRAFLDQLLSQLHPTYAFHLDRYREVVLQRNASLRDLRLGRASDALLPIWEEQMVTHGAEILSRRLACLEELRPRFAHEYGQLSGGETAAIAYAADGADAGEPPPSDADMRRWLSDRLAARRREERERGHTLVGPHRDDLTIRVNDLPARTFASQGQRRSLALALKLAGARLTERHLGVRPILLLDDVLSELDAARRERLLALEGQGFQALVTCTDAEPVKEILRGRGRFYRVRPGEVLEVTTA